MSSLSKEDGEEITSTKARLVFGLDYVDTSIVLWGQSLSTWSITQPGQYLLIWGHDALKLGSFFATSTRHSCAQ